MLPLPDGVVIGRVNLGEVVAASEAAQQQALQAAMKLVQQGSAAQGSGHSAAPAVVSNGADTAQVVSLNATAERGIRFEVGCLALVAIQQQYSSLCVVLICTMVEHG